MVRREQIKSFAGGATIAALAVIAFLWATFPFWWMIFTSFKPMSEILHYPPTIVPKVFTLEHYRHLLLNTRYLTYYFNTVVISVPVSFLSIAFASSAAYGLTRFKFFGSSLIPPFTLICYMLPRILLVISLHGVFRAVGLLDNRLAIVILHLTFVLPYALWLLRYYFHSIPIDMEEAAMVDGATRLQVLTKVVLPLAIPGIVATFIFVFIVSWNDYLYTLAMISTDAKKTLTLGIITGLTDRMAISAWGALMAAGTLMTVPVLILFVFIQRYVVTGFTAGAIKG